MSRLHRLDPEHGIHHVYSRGTRRWALFIDRLDYQTFRHRLGVVCHRYGVTIHAFCLMGNHFHLVVYCQEGNISAALRDLKSLYARRHNDRHGFSGPLFESRFGSKLVASYEYLRTLIRYVHRNPLAIDSRNPLVAHEWSSHRYFVEATLHSPEWLDTTLPLSFFSDRRDYRLFVEGPEALRSQPVRIALSNDVPQDRGDTALSTLLLLVAAVARCEVADIRARKRNGLIGVVMLIATDLGFYTARELADACNFSSASAVFNAVAQTRHRLSYDESLQAVHLATASRLGAMP